MVEWIKKSGPAKIISAFFFWRWGGSKILDFNIATVKRYGDNRLVAKSPFSKKATVYLATVTISTVANYTLPSISLFSAGFALGRSIHGLSLFFIRN